MEPATKDVRDAFQDFLKKNYDVKLKGDGLFSNKDVLYAEKVKINTISDKNLDFYAKIRIFCFVKTSMRNINFRNI